MSYLEFNDLSNLGIELVHSKEECGNFTEKLIDRLSYSLEKNDYFLACVVNKAVIDRMLSCLSVSGSKIINSLEYFCETGSAAFPLEIFQRLKVVSKNIKFLFSCLGARVSFTSATIKLDNVYGS